MSLWVTVFVCLRARCQHAGNPAGTALFNVYAGLVFPAE